MKLAIRSGQHLRKKKRMRKEYFRPELVALRTITLVVKVNGVCEVILIY